MWWFDFPHNTRIELCGTLGTWHALIAKHRPKGKLITGG